MGTTCQDRTFETRHKSRSQSGNMYLPGLTPLMMLIFGLSSVVLADGPPYPRPDDWKPNDWKPETSPSRDRVYGCHKTACWSYCHPSSPTSGRWCYLSAWNTCYSKSDCSDKRHGGCYGRCNFSFFPWPIQRPSQHPPTITGHKGKNLYLSRPSRLQMVGSAGFFFSCIQLWQLLKLRTIG